MRRRPSSPTGFATAFIDRPSGSRSTTARSTSTRTARSDGSSRTSSGSIGDAQPCPQPIGRDSQRPVAFVEILERGDLGRIDEVGVVTCDLGCEQLGWRVEGLAYALDPG